MRQHVLLFIAFLSIVSCSSRKPATTRNTTIGSNRAVRASAEAQSVINYAKTYKGTRYKYGGNTKRGIDCSGLVCNAFSKENKTLPRTTKLLASYGKWVDVKALHPGDLIFFATKKNSRKVNHVGIVTRATPDRHGIQFIHASTSKGVIISSLSESYWYKAYVQSRRVL